ncbi:hypothetical protein BJY59DRAFT_726642, partial [Rhodotorula toruloides]
ANVEQQHNVEHRNGNWHARHPECVLPLLLSPVLRGSCSHPLSRRRRPRPEPQLRDGRLVQVRRVGAARTGNAGTEPSRVGVEAVGARQGVGQGQRGRRKGSWRSRIEGAGSSRARQGQRGRHPGLADGVGWRRFLRQPGAEQLSFEGCLLHRSNAIQAVPSR